MGCGRARGRLIRATTAINPASRRSSDAPITPGLAVECGRPEIVSLQCRECFEIKRGNRREGLNTTRSNGANLKLIKRLRPLPYRLGALLNGLYVNTDIAQRAHDLEYVFSRNVVTNNKQNIRIIAQPGYRRLTLSDVEVGQEYAQPHNFRLS